MMKRMMLAAVGTAAAMIGQAAGQAPVPSALPGGTIVSESPVVPGYAPPAGNAPMPYGPPTTYSTVYQPAAVAPRNQDDFWVSLDFAPGWIFGHRLKPLVTTAAPTTPRASAGVIGDPATQYLFSGRVLDGIRTGARAEVGAWLDDEHRFGVLLGGSWLESKSQAFAASSDGSTVLARPFDSVATGQNAQGQTVTNFTADAVLIAFPGVSAGRIAIDVSSSQFLEGHFDVSECLYESGGLRIDGLIGSRFYRYDEGIRFRQVINPTDANFVAGTEISSSDDFVTHNTFIGGGLGLRARMDFDRLSVGLLGKLAVGNLHREVKISGVTTTTVPGTTPVTTAGGLYALSTNSFRQQYDDWSALPELGVTLGYRVADGFRVRAGYTALMMGGISRGYDQVNFAINPNLLPGAAAGSADPSQPGPTRSRADVWVQSLNVGAEFSW